MFYRTLQAIHFNNSASKPICNCVRSLSHMQCWSLSEYGSNKVLQMNTVQKPTIKANDEILIRVHAASVNPFDVRMRDGYGSRLLNVWRKAKGKQEFPLVLGRDFSGVVEGRGKMIRRFKPGDQVWGSPLVPNGGTHTEYLIAHQDEISHKPSRLSHVEAASFPYVACTVWVALVSRAGLKPEKCLGKRVLVYGGSGGIGTFAIQLLKAWGAHVTTTCSTDAIDLVTSLGADHIVDYKTENLEEQLTLLPGFDVILDPFGGHSQVLSTKLLSSCTGAVYVNLAPPLLPDIDRLGLGRGLFASGQSLVSSFTKKAFTKGGLESWAFFLPNPGALDHVARLCEEHKIRPVVQKVFPFHQTPEAFSHLEAGHTRGKIVIEIEKTQEKDDTVLAE